MNSLLTGWAFLQCDNKYNLQPDTFVQASIADVSTIGLLVDDVTCIAIARLSVSSLYANFVNKSQCHYYKHQEGESQRLDVVKIKF
jgi:hypothetical protein